MHAAPGMLRSLCAGLVLILLTGAAAAQDRVALVIGNGAYRGVPRLANPVTDANAVAEALRGIGFRVDLVREATRATMEEALRRFSRSADGAELALFYYAGHGIQVGGENQLIPVDARLADARDIDFELISLPLVTRAMERARSRVLILDACRDNPLATQMRGLSGTRSVGRGLARIDTVDLGTLVAFSTSPGAVALDGSGRNSPFAAALLQHIRTPGLEIRQLMTRVRRSVVEATGGQQIPWDNSSLIAEVVLRPTAAVAAPVTSAPPPPPRSTPAAAAAPVRGPGEAAGAFARTQQVAAGRQIPLPPDIASLPIRSGPGAHRLVGAWGGESRWNTSGRDAILIVLSVDEASGAADIVFAAGPPSPMSFAADRQAEWFRTRATLRWGTLRWSDNQGDTYEASPLFVGDGLELVHTRGAGWRSNVQARTHLPRLQ